MLSPRFAPAKTAVLPPKVKRAGVRPNLGRDYQPPYKKATATLTVILRARRRSGRPLWLAAPADNLPATPRRRARARHNKMSVDRPRRRRRASPDSSLVRPNEATRPIATPIAASFKPFPMMRRNTSGRCAPRARRIPISRVRCVTRNAITPNKPIAASVSASPANVPTSVIVNRRDAMSFEIARRIVVMSETG